MKNTILLILAIILASCSEGNLAVLGSDQFLSDQSLQTRACVDLHNKSVSNPTLLDDWENVQTIALNTSGNHNVTAPWSNGTASSLSESFRKDIKKEDGWTMLFHTFKQKGLDEKQNYMCFYNQFTGMIKVFYYYEGDRASQGTQWYMKTADGTNTNLFNLTDFLAYSNDVSEINMVVFSNQIGSPVKGIEHGWNGFEFEVPYCTDYKNKEFVIGAYDKVVIDYNFSGDIDLKSTGTITPIRSGQDWQSTVASLAGEGAKALIDAKINKAKDDKKPNKPSGSSEKFGDKLLDAITKIPSGSYAKVISAGLGFIFGKTSVVNDYKINVATTGKLKFGGTGTTTTTSGIPAIAFNLYSLMNSDNAVSAPKSFVYNLADGNEHYLGVWNLQEAPKVFFQRICSCKSTWGTSLDKDGTYHVDIELDAPVHWTYYNISLNPDLKSYANWSTSFKNVVRCDSLFGNRYKPKMIDIGDYLHASLFYRDNEKRFYDLDGYLRTGYRVTPLQTNGKLNYYYDWGNIDCGRHIGLINTDIVFNYSGKQIKLEQTRLYPTGYGIDIDIVEDVDNFYNKGYNIVVNRQEPFYEYQKKKNGIPIINYEP